MAEHEKTAKSGGIEKSKVGQIRTVDSMCRNLNATSWLFERDYSGLSLTIKANGLILWNMSFASIR